MYLIGKSNYITAFYVCQKTAAAIRIDPAKAPNVDKMKAQTEEGKNLRKHMYSNDNYKEFVESILPWLNRRGSLD